MKTLHLLLLISVGLLAVTPSATLAQNNSGSKANPFEELKDAVDAAVAAEAAAREAADMAEASARAAADSAEETARIAGDNAESAARAAEDAALSAAIAAEEAARIAADITLQAEIDAHAASLANFDGRVSVLEGLLATQPARSVTWTDTAGTFDVTDIPGAISALNYQPGEWMAFISSNAATGREFGNCTNNARVANFLNAAATGSFYYSDLFSGSDTYFLSGGDWFPSTSIALYSDSSAGSGGPYLQIWNASGNHYVKDRLGDYFLPNYEIYSFQISGGFGVGNTLTLIVAATRQEACGF